MTLYVFCRSNFHVENYAFFCQCKKKNRVYNHTEFIYIYFKATARGMFVCGHYEHVSSGA